MPWFNDRGEYDPYGFGEPCGDKILGIKAFDRLSFGLFAVPALTVFSVMALLRLLAMRLALRPLAAAAVGPAEADARMRVKFIECAWRTVVYAINSAWAFKCLVLAEVPWLHDSLHFWKGWPEEHVVTPDLLSLYSLYLGIYVHLLFFLFIDVKTSDFPALLAHHMITISIILFSWHFRFIRIGSFVMSLHDVSDIFLEAAKCFNYAKARYPRIGLSADVSFVFFAVTFFVLRLGIFPTRVLYSAAFDACPHLNCAGITPDAPLSQCVWFMMWLVPVPLLSGLQLLQIFWGWKIVGVIVTILRGKELDDPRDE